MFPLLLAVVGFVALVRTDKELPRERRPVTVTLMRPSAAEIKEKPPSPEEEKKPEQPPLEKQTFVSPENSSLPPREGGNPKGDDKPAAEGPLGVGGEGGAGSDAFGLVGRGRGGREITTIGTGPAGGGIGMDRAAAMRKYGGYYRVLKEELQKGINKRLEGEKDVPKGRLEVLVWLSIEDGGAVGDCRITRSSGSEAMDRAVKEYLNHARMQSPPQGMPRDVSLRFTY